MILPRKWFMGRPGFLIPVFFLSWCQVFSQLQHHDSGTLALGQCYVSRSGLATAALNQAGLGRLTESTTSLHHLRPYIIPQLDIISLSAQISLDRGGPGLAFSSMGISGLRQSSVWISYGLRLHTRISAGAGIHFRFTSIPENILFHSEAGFAIGLQFLLSEDLVLGAHLKQPAAWTDARQKNSADQMMICTGFSYAFFQTASVYSEFHITTSGPVQWCNGLTIEITGSIQLYLGINTKPWSLSGGLSFDYRNWGITLAVACYMDAGISPATSLSHAW